jgi:predicted nucleic acid-binding protein
MAANKFVLDASVLMKWFFTLEAEASLAARVKKDIETKKIKAYIPRYAVIEVLSVLSRTPPFNGSPALTASEVREQLVSRKSWFKGKLKQKRLGDGELERALFIVNSHGIVFYDAVYIALAEKLKARLVTADYKSSVRLTTRGDVIELRAYT